MVIDLNNASATMDGLYVRNMMNAEVLIRRSSLALAIRYGEWRKYLTFSQKDRRMKFHLAMTLGSSSLYVETFCLYIRHFVEHFT